MYKRRNGGVQGSYIYSKRRGKSETLKWLKKTNEFIATYPTQLNSKSRIWLGTKNHPNNVPPWVMIGIQRIITQEKWP